MSRFELFVRLCKVLPDTLYLRIIFYLLMRRKLNLKTPQSLNEKLQWLKLHDRNPSYILMVDKFRMKGYIDDLIGKGYTIPTIGVWDSFEEIDFDNLPNQFVLKCTHDSGGLVIVQDKKKLVKEKVRIKINRCLKKNYFYSGREWPYKKVKPKIIAERYMVDESGYELKDYKIFCFNGHAEYIEVDFNRAIKHKLNPYDFNWNPLNFCDSSKNDYSVTIPKPKRLNDMRRLAEKIAENIPFLRVDMYCIQEKIYIGELTFYPGSGFIKFDPPRIDYYYGNKLNLKGLK